MFGERRTVRLSNPSSGLSLRVLGGPEAPVISKLHYGPRLLESGVRISTFSHPACATLSLDPARVVLRHTVMPIMTRPATTPTNAITWPTFTCSLSIAMARTTVTIGYALDIGTTKEAKPLSNAYE